jgi:hypothetical protein
VLSAEMDKGVCVSVCVSCLGSLKSALRASGPFISLSLWSLRFLLAAHLLFIRIALYVRR